MPSLRVRIDILLNQLPMGTVFRSVHDCLTSLPKIFFYRKANKVRICLLCLRCQANDYSLILRNIQNLHMILNYAMLMSLFMKMILSIYGMSSGHCHDSIILYFMVLTLEINIWLCVTFLKVTKSTGCVRN